MLDLTEVKTITESNTNIPVIYKEFISKTEAYIKEKACLGLDTLVVNLDAVLHIGNTFEDFTEHTYRKVDCIINYFTSQAFQVICFYEGGAVVHLLISWNENVVGVTDCNMIRRCCEFAVKCGMEGK